MSENGPNHRKSERAAIELKVEYKKLNGFFSDYTKNISKGGTFIKTSKPLAIGTEFVFKLFVPFSEQAFELRGEVAWVNTYESLLSKRRRPRALSRVRALLCRSRYSGSKDAASSGHNRSARRCLRSNHSCRRQPF